MNTKKLLKELFIIAFANLLVAIGSNVFLIGANLYPTGLIGLSTEFSQILSSFLNINISYNLIYLFLNIPIVILGYFKVGKKFIIRTLASILFFTFFAAIVPQAHLIDPSQSGDQLISAIISAIIMGVGVGILLKIGSSGGGLDIIAVFISLYKGKSFGLYSLLLNSVVIILAFLLSQDFVVASLTLINLYILNTVIDHIHNSQEKRVLIVITNKADEVAKEMYANIARGITIIDSVGGYSKNKNNTLVISISNGELYSAINIIKSTDDKAFINVLKADKVIGNFENPYQKML